MKQSKLMSALESGINIAVGLGVAMVANAIILPLVGFPVTLAQNAVIAAFMTVVSFARSYALRRLFEAMNIRAPMSAFALAVLAERQRQITHEGRTTEHDDEHLSGDLAMAGAAYLQYAARHDARDPDERVPSDWTPNCWMWDRADFKPRDGLRRNLIKGAALAIAEGERFDRNRKRRPQPGMTSGYQPSEGHRPTPPSTGSGVVPPFAHNKSAREHAGPSQ